MNFRAKYFVCILFILVVTCFHVSAQDSGSIHWHFGDSLFSHYIIPIKKITDNDRKPLYIKDQSFTGVLTILTRNLKSFKQFLKSIPCEILDEHNLSNTVVIRVKHASILEKILASSDVVFINDRRAPVEESTSKYQDNRVNRINFVHEFFPEYTGEGLTVSIKERSIDTTDIDLRGRVKSSVLADEEITLHANQIATIIAGAGNTAPNAKGIAWKSNVTSSSFDKLLPDDNSILQSEGVSVQNHSYGIGIENFYGAEAKAYDANVVGDPTLLHVFSSGNSGMQTPAAGKYAGVEGYANLTGNMKMAKNVLVTGGHFQDMTIDKRNSRGPAYDGRIKPELVAYGPEGTSDAAAVVSGVALLLQNAYLKSHNTLPKIDILKAVLVASADDAGSAGIDFITGYGAVNAHRAIQMMRAQTFRSGTVQQGQHQTFSVAVPSGIKTLRVAMNYIDPPANAADDKALINDLDLEVIHDEKRWLPWVLSPYPHPDSLQLPSRRKSDHLNNTELITVEDPEPGIFQFNIVGQSLTTTSQDFAVAYWLDTADVFVWTSPAIHESFDSEKEIYFRWESTYSGMATLEISVNGESFDEIDNAVSLQQGFYRWMMPPVSGVAVARMKIGNNYFNTAPFTLSPPLPLKIGFVCNDEFMLNWDQIDGAEQYQVHMLNGRYLETIATATDTVLMLDRSIYSSRYFAVTPMIKTQPGLRSVTYNIEDQGVRCYYTTFFGEVAEPGVAELQLTLSTTYNVSAVKWEKEIEHSFQMLSKTEIDKELLHTFTDAGLKGGVSRYRASIILKDGREMVTDTAFVYYADENTYEVFPNPIHGTNDELQVFTNGEDISISFYDMAGKVVMTQQVLSHLFKFPLPSLPDGLYVYRIFRQSTPMASGRLVVIR